MKSKDSFYLTIFFTCSPTKYGSVKCPDFHKSIHQSDGIIFLQTTQLFSRSWNWVAWYFIKFKETTFV